jgi:tRNA (mo5U34)-methyltransferase
MLSKEDVIRKVSEVPFWGHSIPLPYGIVTPGKVMNNLETFNRLDLPSDLRGKRILDIGAFDGFYSFECEKKGAKVLAIDNLERCERPEEKQYKNLGNKGFMVAKEILNSKVEYMDMDVYDISKEKIGSFDIILFLGVLYHLKYPLLALEKIFQCLNDGGMALIETEYMKNLSKEPQLWYVGGGQYNMDPTNWHIPNSSCLERMAKDVGFNKTEVVWESINWKRWLKTILQQRIYRTGRIILKAYK